MQERLEINTGVTGADNLLPVVVLQTAAGAAEKNEAVAYEELETAPIIEIDPTAMLHLPKDARRPTKDEVSLRVFCFQITMPGTIIETENAPPILTLEALFELEPELKQRKSEIRYCFIHTFNRCWETIPQLERNSWFITISVSAQPQAADDKRTNGPAEALSETALLVARVKTLREAYFSALKMAITTSSAEDEVDEIDEQPAKTRSKLLARLN
ncbi:MAG: hypothetical protein PVJ09_02705 [Candidatus Woesebacteria bacterium]|jgi:hypothetical protein